MPNPADYFLMLAGSSALKLATAIPEIKRLSKAIKEVKEKIAKGATLSKAQEQVYRQMQMSASELASETRDYIERVQSVNETGQLGEPAEMAMQSAADAGMQIARERQGAIATAQDQLVAEQTGLEQARGQVWGEMGAGLAQDTSSLVGSMAAADSEQKALDKMLNRIQGAPADFNSVLGIMKTAKDGSSMLQALLQAGVPDKDAAGLVAQSKFGSDAETAETAALEAATKGP